ncbi:hypothetical protein [Microvirga puerhi]|uniref:Uncharacterized protein n=1 Tax=Microvirga puerhi TaxID=2876078 RepID=A0ABS7VRL9_9HYPH|nr:hypothetical protein [Microvirga puerhi]MBZ6077592.1 hypothetical protein [Microvirga puerhi]
MHIVRKTLMAATIACAMGSLTAMAAPGGNPGPPPWAGGPGGNPNAPGQNKGAPGPLAGAGLPFLLLAGGYALVRRYRARSRSAGMQQDE